MKQPSPPQPGPEQAPGLATNANADAEANVTVLAPSPSIRAPVTRALTLDRSRTPDAFHGTNAEVDANLDPPPAYGDLPDRIHFSRDDIDAGATVTVDGRVNVQITAKSRVLAQVLSRTTAAVPASPARELLPPAYLPLGAGGSTVSLQQQQQSPPPLNVVIMIVGSRGDVQPFVALGQELRDRWGHRVRLATHAAHASLVTAAGLEFFCIGADPAELMAFMVKNPGLMPGLDALTSGEIARRRRGMEQILRGCWRACREPGDGTGVSLPPHSGSRTPDYAAYLAPPDPSAPSPFVADAIIANPPCFAHVHIAEKMGIPLHMMFTMPWSPTKAFPHPLANILSTNADETVTNYVSYAMVEMMTWQGLGDIINRFRENELGLDRLSPLWAPGLLSRLRVPYTYCWSSALIPKPADWGPEVDVAGFFFLDLGSSYVPDPALAAFLAAGPPPVYIGFGSVVVSDPAGLTKLVLEAVLRTGCRALVSHGWGGLGVEELQLPDTVMMLGNVPHDWLFSRVATVVHHGGAGTTAAGIRAGRPTVVVPFFGDQPFWGAMICRAGAGPEPIPIRALTADLLAAAIRHCAQPETVSRAAELGHSIRHDTGARTGAASFHARLPISVMRCALAPSRPAVWRLRRTNVPLSSLAAAVLVARRALNYSDLKLYRSKEYVTDDQPWDPITAVTSVVIMDVGGIVLGVADVPRNIFKAIAARAKSRKTTDPTQATTSTTTNQTEEGEGKELVAAPAAAPAKGRGDEPDEVSLESAMRTGLGISRVIGASARGPMNVCLGLARGFRNAPRLYNDDTIRPVDKVTDLTSGLRVAGKEFGLGMYDGISGFVTQPIRGAEKEGGIGLLKGIGKGIGGLILKPAAAMMSLPAYTMQGVRAQVRNSFRTSVDNHTFGSRIQQGQLELVAATTPEQDDVAARWIELAVTDKKRLDGFLSLKGSGSRMPSGQSSTLEAEPAADSELERAISTAVRETSRGDGLEDARVEQAIRATLQTRASTETIAGSPSSLLLRTSPPQHARTGRHHTDEWDVSQVSSPIAGAEMVRDEKALVRRQGGESSTAVAAPPPPFSPFSPYSPPSAQLGLDRGRNVEKGRTAAADERITARQDASTTVGFGAVVHGSPQSRDADPDRELTDQEFQALIEEAIKQSLVTVHDRSPMLPHDHDTDDDNDKDFRRAVAQSEAAHRDALVREASARSEEDIVLEYIKRQSLAEAEHRKAAAAQRRTE